MPLEREVGRALANRGNVRLVVSAPAKDPDVTVTLGVNFDDAYDAEVHRSISSGSTARNRAARPTAGLDAWQIPHPGRGLRSRRASGPAVRQIPTVGTASSCGFSCNPLGALHGCPRVPRRREYSA